MHQNRVLAVHDISCVGKCSLTVAIPIISATGVECSALPTAVLSTQTGGFTGFTYRDLTEDIRPIMEHWLTLDLKFDGIYTGFLGSYEQIDLVSELFRKLGKDSVKFVDPVMGDEGELYPVFDESFPEGMRRLCSLADVVMPNITEAGLMLGEEYAPGPCDKDEVEDILVRISSIGPKKVFLTDVSFDEGEIGVATYDAERDDISYASAPSIPGYYQGTGDVFSSVVVGCCMNGLPIDRAAEIAVDFTQRCVVRTYEAGTDVRYGVDFESGIPRLLDEIGLTGRRLFITRERVGQPWNPIRILRALRPDNPCPEPWETLCPRTDVTKRVISPPRHARCRPKQVVGDVPAHDRRGYEEAGMEGTRHHHSVRGHLHRFVLQRSGGHRTLACRERIQGGHHLPTESGYRQGHHPSRDA